MTEGPANRTHLVAQGTPGALGASYAGTFGQLLGLALRTGLLSLVTFGFYRFWERTRIRRYIWSAIRIGDDPLAYVGTGLEKLLGFFVAVIILAILLGIVQSILVFSGLSLISLDFKNADLWISFGLAQVSVLVVTPLAYFARYRAMRYRVSRTRCRGIRFAMDPGAIGFAWRGVVYLLLTLASLGVLWPLLTYRLEKYRIDRTHYGDARFLQEGSWPMLYGSMRHFLFAGLAAFALVWVLPLAAAVVGAFWMMFAYVYYRVDSFRRLTATKRLIIEDGEGVSFKATPRVGRVLRHLLLGGLLVLALGGLVSTVFFAALGGLNAADVSEPRNLTGISIPQLVLSLLGIVVALTIYGSLVLVCIVQPILRHVSDSIEIADADKLDRIRQRDRDDFADADGFASALDLGGAF